MREQQGWRIEEGEGPLVAAATHDGHALRPEVEGLLAVSEADRLREEDPYTAAWTEIAPTRIIGLRSRFEVDLNRPRQKAVYLEPEDAWGLAVWNHPPPPPELLARSLASYDAFYDQLGRSLEKLVRRFGRVVVFDLHSYNHRRAGPEQPADDPQKNPEVDLDTCSMDRRFWRPVADCFLDVASTFDFLGRRLDVRENVLPGGFHFAQWIHTTFPRSVCTLVIEIKKFFMDEWTGRLYPAEHETVGRMLAKAARAVCDALDDISNV